MQMMRVALVCLAAISVVGCTGRKRSFQPPVDPATLDDAAFLHYLATVPVVTVDEGTRGLLLLIGPTKDFPTFEARTAELERRGAYRSAWHLSADDVLDKGTLAYALVPLCDTPASINTTAAGMTGIADRRAALQVCVYQELLTAGETTSAVTGGEFLAALDAAERITTRRGGAKKSPRP